MLGADNRNKSNDHDNGARLHLLIASHMSAHAELTPHPSTLLLFPGQQGSLAQGRWQQSWDEMGGGIPDSKRKLLSPQEAHSSYQTCLIIGC